ncbi:MAG: DUF4832 domain-containing protein [Kiritimatiellae bacterium]|jgi:hypothetical protein|nr:DUF4832 domain-containing protein [Kiritimatiellia bacterium]
MKSNFFVLMMFFAVATLSAQERVTVNPVDTGKALVNPGMGWTMHFYSNVPKNYGSKLEPVDTVDDFPGLSTVYLRIPWAYIEPEEGRFNWAILDTPAQRWIAKGKKIALRLTCSENWMKYATPEWVKNAGAKGSFYIYGKGPVKKSNSWDPYFDDSVFLAKLEKFLAAAAARYDGNPDVEFIDVGTYGMWGEGHTHGSIPQDSFEIKKLHIDLHLKHFRNTLLCISDDFAGHDNRSGKWPIVDYALSQGVTIRDDSILVQPPPRSWYHADMAQMFWPTLPVILEHQHYGPSVNNKAWSKELLLKSVEDYHASFMSIHWWPRILLNENRDVIDKINLRMGYRLMPVNVSWPAKIKVGQHFKVQWKWANKGVSPCYPGGYPALTLKDEKGGIVSVLSDESLDMKTLKTGALEKAPVFSHESEFVVGLVAPTTKAGKYDVYVSVGARDGTPRIALPLKDDDGQRRYQLGTIEIVK